MFAVYNAHAHSTYDTKSKWRNKHVIAVMMKNIYIKQSIHDIYTVNCALQRAVQYFVICLILMKTKPN